MTILKEEIKQYSAHVGADPLLVQGAGGNISWKENNTLWIKASGTWLVDAVNKEIFLPLDLRTTLELIKQNKEDFTTAVTNNATLRPSIETSLHAVLPHKVVVHVHAVDIIAHAVLQDAKQYFEKSLKGLNWVWIDYVKPGISLASKISTVVTSYEIIPDIFILGNHGIIVAGDSIKKIEALLQEVLSRCKILPRKLRAINEKSLAHLAAEWSSTEYQLPTNKFLHSLALDEVAVKIAQTHWVMYPDHAIFLGVEGIFKKNRQSVDTFLSELSHRPPCIIVQGEGVVVHKKITSGQQAMLDCYLNVIARLKEEDKIQGLKKPQILELLDWDAEKYRQKINT